MQSQQLFLTYGDMQFRLQVVGHTGHKSIKVRYRNQAASTNLLTMVAIGAPSGQVQQRLLEPWRTRGGLHGS